MKQLKCRWPVTALFLLSSVSASAYDFEAGGIYDNVVAVLKSEYLFSFA